MLNFKLSKEHGLEKNAMRTVYCDTLIALANSNKNIVALDADLMSSMGMNAFKKTFPDRMFNCGVQEANMIGVAAGLSSIGKIPYAHTFGPFASRRCFDQIFLSCAYSKQNVRIIGSDPGITAAYNGGTHMPFEDLALMRTVPEMNIIVPSDSVMLEDIIRKTENLYGNFYIQLLRNNAVSIYEKGSKFTLGKANKIVEGKDITIIANGIMVSECLIAAEQLSKIGIHARILDMFCLKPIDKESILNAAQETGAIVTVENHNIINGLASAVSEVIVEECLVPMGKIGVRDQFGQVGSVEYLKEVYHLTPQDIVEEVIKTLKRKK
ncbi:MAG: transketolase family protein [Fusobacteria bacterium]|nr:transketolase family protein [Fusobacteriota bacterium]